MTPRPGLSTTLYRVRAMLVIASIAALALIVLPSRALARSYSIDYVDIDATVATDGSLSVGETREFDFNGSYNGVYWKIPTGDYDGRQIETSIDTVGIIENGRLTVFTQSSSGSPNTYSISQEKGAIKVKLYSPHTDEKVQFFIAYTDTNLAARYTDTSELYWKFVSSGWDVESKNVTCTIHLPVPDGAMVSAEENVRAWGHGPLDGNVNFKGNDIVYTLPGVGGSEYAEARITFPTFWLSDTQTINMSKLQTILSEEQSWADQANAKRQAAIVFSYGSLALACLVALGSIAFSLFRWGKYKRTHKPQFDDDYFRDVPSDDHPAVLGALLSNGKPHGKELTASLMRLTDIGAVQLDLVRTTKQGFLGSERTDEDYRLTRTEQDISQEAEKRKKVDYATLTFLFDKVAPYEGSHQELYFNSVETIAKEHAEQYSSAYETWESVIEGSCISRGFFNDTRGTGKGALIGLGVLNILLAIAMIAFTIVEIVPIPLGFGVVAVLAVAALVTFVVASKSSSLSDEALELQAKLKALRRWLKDFTRLGEAIPTDVVLWNQLLVMAVVLDVADEVIKQLKTTMPQILEDARIAPVYGWYYYGGTRDMPVNAFSGSVAHAHSVSTASLAASSMSSGGGGGGGFSGGGGGGFGDGGGGGAF